MLVEGSQTWECDAMINMDALAFLYTNQLGCSSSSNSDFQDSETFSCVLKSIKKYH